MTWSSALIWVVTLMMAGTAMVDLAAASLPPTPAGSRVYRPPPAGQSGGTHEDDASSRSSVPGGAARPWGPASGPYAYGYSYQRYYQNAASEQPVQSHHHDVPRTPEAVYPRILRTIGNTGVCILFMVLAARAVQLYEMADLSTGVMRRYVVTAPTVALLSANLLGVLLSVVNSFARNHKLKTRLKGILTVNAMVELLMLVHNTLRLVLGDDGWTPREVYVGRLFHGVWMLTVIYAFASSRWETTNLAPRQA